MALDTSETDMTAANNGLVLSETGVPLTRQVAFKFALDPTREQSGRLMAHAGAARFAYNHHVARIKANLDQRRAEATYGVPLEQLTPAVPWSTVSFINEFNAWKTGGATDSPVNADGTRGLAWRAEVDQEVFECASVNAAQAFKNFRDSRSGSRKGTPCRFPRFKSRRKSTPAFKLRSRSKPGQRASIRVAGPKALRFPSLGELRIHGCTERVRKMLSAGRLRLFGASFRFERGRWWVTLQGIAAAFHPARRSHVGRHSRPAGMDAGVKSLAIVADTEGVVLHRVKGVRALQNAQLRLRRANKALARTKPGSNGQRQARNRLTRLHARIASQRTNAAHELSKILTTRLVTLTIEDLNLPGLLRNRPLARALSDAGIGELGRQLRYKAAWYGCALIEADRWFPSSKTCSGCGQVNGDLTLADRTYRCTACGHVADRDVNAAVNLARWPDRHGKTPRTAA